ncbi:MAG: hypothetical protein AABP62_14925 [Planctomycetota bacterium]
MKWLFIVAGLVLLAATLTGPPTRPLENPIDRRVVELATKHAEQQATQSRQMAELQKQWQTERSELNQQRDRLEAERRELANQREREPVIAQSIHQLGTLALCLLPLIVCALLLRKSNEPDQGDGIAETLISDLMSRNPVLFPTTLPAPSSPELPAPSSADEASSRLVPADPEPPSIEEPPKS